MAKRRLNTEQRKTQTLRRVTRVFASKGFSGTTSRALARAAGVSEALLYKLFGSKQGLYRAMIEHKLADAGWGDFPVDPGAGSDEDFFRGMAQAIFAKVDADPDFVRLLLYSDLQGSEFARMFHEAMGGGVVRAVGDYIRTRIAAGALRAVDPDLTGVAFLCMTWQYAIGTKVFANDRLPQVPDELAIESLVSLFLHGIQA
jgi:TetR/AcrR family transcriptional regulator